MSAAAQEPEPTAAAGADDQAAALGAFAEALRQALKSASREQVLRQVAVTLPIEIEPGPAAGLHGKVEKVSVSMPSELTETVRSRAGSGGFSRYVTEALQERIRLDLLDDLSAELQAEYGPVDPQLVRQAMTEWPDFRQD